MLRLLIAFVIAYTALVAILMLRQRSFIYFPQIPGIPNIANAPWMSEIEVTTTDGLKIKSWFSPPKEGKPTIVFFHGNAGNVEMIAAYKGLPFVQAGFGLLAAEYRGYSGNPGGPSEEGLYKDARAQIDWLAKEKNIKGDDLIIYGESVGSGVAVQMATEYAANALILEVPFSSMLDVARTKYFFVPFISKTLKDKYMNHEKIGSVHIPILMGIGGHDMVVTAHLGKKLFNAANEPKTLKVYDKAGHNTLYEYGFARDVIEFINAQGVQAEQK